MKASIANVTIRGLGKYSQSRAHEAGKLDGESHEDYDKRTWREHLHVRDGLIVIPETAILQCIQFGAKYASEKKKGTATWTKHYKAGLGIVEPATTGIKASDVIYEDIYSNADGVRGSGKRVYRRFPILAPWTADFRVLILDPEITHEHFIHTLEIAGRYGGLGRWRPENGGQNGRFVVEACEWLDNRELKDIARK